MVGERFFYSISSKFIVNNKKKKANNETDLFCNILIELKLLFYIISFNARALGIHAAPKDLFPLFVAVPQLEHWISLRLVGHGRLNIFLDPKNVVLRFKF